MLECEINPRKASKLDKQAVILAHCSCCSSHIQVGIPCLTLMLLPDHAFSASAKEVVGEFIYCLTRWHTGDSPYYLVSDAWLSSASQYL